MDKQFSIRIMEDKDLKTLPKLKNKNNFRHWQQSVLYYLGGKKLAYQFVFSSVVLVSLMTEEETNNALLNMQTIAQGDNIALRIVHLLQMTVPNQQQGFLNRIPIEVQEEVINGELVAVYHKRSRNVPRSLMEFISTSNFIVVTRRRVLIFYLDDDEFWKTQTKVQQQTDHPNESTAANRSDNLHIP